MKARIDLKIVAIVLVLVGLRQFTLHGPEGTETAAVVARVSMAVLGILAVIAGTTLWERRPSAVAWYAAWATVLVLSRAAHAVVGDHEPALAAGLLVVFTGAAWFAVGLYLRSVVRAVA